eukprot:CAMPEP_0169392378 /NCGR_PEP_ID=MMETSP1017-20121227/48671_1 /TAXON_ID=342587 /ORGANISM="Karlodinium micrum, Strain CCMP2283" /LENGTH=66 /DNA_ID=CAMNT_0009495483 /DNA_START=328 /DNA_END=524 /DNA_ORIENTATION=+
MCSLKDDSFIMSRRDAGCEASRPVVLFLRRHDFVCSEVATTPYVLKDLPRFEPSSAGDPLESSSLL